MKKTCLTFFVFFWAISAWAMPVEEIDYAGLIGKIGAAKGKVVVINFWASWCAPCRIEIPDLLKTRDYFSKDEVVILGVSVDRRADTVADFGRAFGLNYTLLHAHEDVSSGFRIRGIPRTMIYSRSGEKVVDHVGLVDFPSLSHNIKKLLED